MSDYQWADQIYPCFYPVAQYDDSNLYYIELGLTFYPYLKGSTFDENAYPIDLRRFPDGYAEAPTQFFFQVRDWTDRVIENLSYENAVEIADELNNQYNDIIKDCEQTWDWSKFPIKLSMNDLVATK